VLQRRHALALLLALVGLVGVAWWLAGQDPEPARAVDNSRANAVVAAPAPSAVVSDVAREPTASRTDSGVDPEPEWGIEVQVVANVRGRVQTTSGEPVVAARVTVFARIQGVPSGAPVGRCNTDREGGYQLRVPPEVPLEVVAVAMAPALLSGLTFAGEDGGVMDCGEMRAELLAASQSIEVAVGETRQLPDLVLGEPAFVRGTVRWANGQPVAAALVLGAVAGGCHLDLDATNGLRCFPWGLAALARVRTGTDGAFALPGLPGGAIELVVPELAGFAIVGDWPRQHAAAPSSQDVVLPMPVTVTVRREGVPVPRARVEIAASRDFVPGSLPLPGLAAGDDGVLRFVSQHLRVTLRAEADGMRSPLRVVDPTREQSVDLELSLALVEVAIELRGEVPVRNATCRWARADGMQGNEALLRDDPGQPFRIHLEPGRYALQLGPGSGEHHGRYLLPLEHRIEVAAAPLRVDLPVAFGGRLAVFATDGRGLHIAGRCKVVGPDGRERLLRFLERESGAIGAPGELLAGGANDCAEILVPGEYLLEFEFDEQGSQRQRVTVRAREVVDVRLRLP
jgi:hypothetical protein